MAELGGILMSFIGRKFEQNKLNNLYADKMGRIVVIYGRRRIGKSELIHEFCKNKKSIFFEGLEHESTKAQINNFVIRLAEQTQQSHLLQTKFQNWESLFNYLTQNIFSNGQKTVLVFDELQWMAAGQSRLINQIKSFWDQHWRRQGVFLILCGSIAHFMVKKVIQSKALYGRIDSDLLIEGLLPNEIKQFLPTRNSQEILRYMLVLGGVPKYFEILDKRKSLEVNFNNLMFQSSGFFVNEFEKIFYSQFKEHRTYKAIVVKLNKQNLSLDQISRAINYASGGSLKSYLDNLELTGFIKSYTSIGKFSGKQKKYKLNDEFIHFYLKFIQPHHGEIVKNKGRNLFQNYVKNSWSSWLGIAFERFCYKHADLIAEKLDFFDKVERAGPLFSIKMGYQFDLVYFRTDKTATLCEIKYYDQPVDTEVIKEFSEKLKKYVPPRGFSVEKVLITSSGVTDSLRKAEYFNHIFNIDQLF